MTSLQVGMLSGSGVLFRVGEIWLTGGTYAVQVDQEGVAPRIHGSFKANRRSALKSLDLANIELRLHDKKRVKLKIMNQPADDLVEFEIDDPEATTICLEAASAGA